MAQQDDNLTTSQRFEKWNPYAEKAISAVDDSAFESANVYAQLAIAFALTQLRSEIHFAGKRGQR